MQVLIIGELIDGLLNSAIKAQNKNPKYKNQGKD